MKTPHLYLIAGWAGNDWYWDSGFNDSYPALAWQNPSGTPLYSDLFSGGDGTSEDPYQITTASQLNNMRIRMSGTYFILMNDIDMSGTTENDEGGDGWDPIGYNTAGSEFSSSLDGNGHKISNLFINRTASLVGMFGATKNSEIKDLGLSNVNITGSGSYIGTLAGLNYGTITRCYSKGTVSGSSFVGGLSGGNENWDGSPGEITNSYSTASVTASADGGGLVGRMISGNFTNCYSTGSVNNGGGLIGLYGSGTISNSFWDKTTSGQSTSSGDEGTGKTTAEMKTLTTFTSAGWNFEMETDNGINNYWDIDKRSH
jgi:hypothetical protein